MVQRSDLVQSQMDARKALAKAKLFIAKVKQKKKVKTAKLGKMVIEYTDGYAGSVNDLLNGKPGKDYDSIVE